MFYLLYVVAITLSSNCSSQVIKDLRALFKTVFAEFATLKDTCSSIEDKQSTTMLDTRDELEDITQIVSILTQNDIRLRKDQEKLQVCLHLSTASGLIVT